MDLTEYSSTEVTKVMSPTKISIPAIITSSIIEEIAKEDGSTPEKITENIGILASNRKDSSQTDIVDDNGNQKGFFTLGAETRMLLLAKSNKEEILPFTNRLINVLDSKIQDENVRVSHTEAVINIANRLYLEQIRNYFEDKQSSEYPFLSKFITPHIPTPIRKLGLSRNKFDQQSFLKEVKDLYNEEIERYEDNNILITHQDAIQTVIELETLTSVRKNVSSKGLYPDIALDSVIKDFTNPSWTYSHLQEVFNNFITEGKDMNFLFKRIKDK